MLTKETIIKLLETDDRAVARALVVLTARQTQDEQAQGTTRYLNGRGYRPCHARMGASMSQFFLRNNYLSPKQVAYWRGRDKTGSMRIGIYAGQLLEEAAEKAKRGEMKRQFQAAFEAQNFPPVTPLVMSEADTKEKARLEYELGMVMDSDDEQMVGAAAGELDDFMRKVRAKSA